MKLDHRLKKILSYSSYRSFSITGVSDEFICIKAHAGNETAYLLPLNYKNMYYLWYAYDDDDGILFLQWSEDDSWYSKKLSMRHSKELIDIYHSIVNI